MSTFSEYCFEILKNRDPTIIPDNLVKSKVTERDIKELEAVLGYQIPQDFKEFLMSYYFPEGTRLYGEFIGDWAGAGITFSRALKKYIVFEDIPVEEDTNILEFVMSGLWSLTDLNNHSFSENMLKSEWLIADKSGYLFLGEFLDYYLFLNLELGTVVYVDHDYIGSLKDIKQTIKENKVLLFQNFTDFLKCLFLGEICNGQTAKIV